MRKEIKEQRRELMHLSHYLHARGERIYTFQAGGGVGDYHSARITPSKRLRGELRAPPSHVSSVRRTLYSASTNTAALHVCYFDTLKPLGPCEDSSSFAGN